MKIAVINIIALVVVTLVLSSAGYPQLAPAPREEPVFRAPFTLKLRMDKEHYYEQSFDAVPYVAENCVYLFAGETFGVNVIIAGNQLSGITYQRDLTKADVEFRFTQENSPNGSMMLVIRNKLKRRLFLDALMIVPERKIFRTNVLPIEPNLTDFESWPHPIVQLVLRNFRFSGKGPQENPTDEKPTDDHSTDDHSEGDPTESNPGASRPVEPEPRRRPEVPATRGSSSSGKGGRLLFPVRRSGWA